MTAIYIPWDLFDPLPAWAVPLVVASTIATFVVTVLWFFRQHRQTGRDDRAALRSAVRQAMLALARLALLLVSGYALVWGASWLLGDKSAVVFGVGDTPFTRYPGVLFDGLPPIAVGEDLAQFLAIVLGLAGVLLVVVSLLRSSR